MAPGQAKSYEILEARRTDGVPVDHARFALFRPPQIVGDKPLTENDKTMKDWMVKLGMCVKYNLAPPDDKEEYAFRIPEGYELRTKSYTSKSSLDHMLYGHPHYPYQGYRSPAEFAPHLFWLISSSQDYRDCSCGKCRAHCDAVDAAINASRSMSSVGTSLESIPSSSGARVGPRKRLGGGSEVFRAGELVWYQHSAWRLGIVREIKYNKNVNRAGGEVQYVRIAPISHVSLNAQDVVNPKIMRPFLSFSVPTATKEFENKTYEQIDWNQHAQHYLSTPDLNPEALGLEASKMAARMINCSFSLFNKDPNPPTGGQQTWSGCFSGAELVHVGDALRVTSSETGQANPNDFDVMLLSSITKEGARLNFHGDIFRLTKVAVATTPLANPAGAVFADEINIRNRVTIPRGFAWSWAMVEKGGIRNEEETWGRFYVTDGLMHAIDPGSFEREAQKGEVVDAGRFLNYRLQPPVRYIGRKPTRMAMIGSSVSSPIVLGDEIVEDEDDIMG